ncbi:MAG: pyridoxal-phosphate dependent enzyme [Anaerolineales bacterium]|nr:pyridoxal-phosphate dependent enzyme [Anaerolineales bacterium]
MPSLKPKPACTHCGQKWLDAVYDLARIGPGWPQRLRQYGASMWRYRELLPVKEDAHIVTLGEGWTPLLPALNLGLMLGHPRLYIKDERQGPTGSFKDRQAAIAVSAMKAAGCREAVVASTGNVAIAYSAFCARAGIKLWAFVPSSVPAEKMREVALYGTEVIKVTGTYDQTKQVAARFAATKNLFLDEGIKGIAAKEGMKTLGFEIAEQLGALAVGLDPYRPGGSVPAWRTPDWYVQAVSGGLGPVGVMKGFAELREMGLVERLPKLACIQVAGCAPMAQAFRRGQRQPLEVPHPHTDINVLATGLPGQAYEVLFDLMTENGGVFETVSDADAFRAMHALAKIEGLSVEPATAVAFAGVIEMVRAGVIDPGETVVINCSGHTFPVEKHILGEQIGRDMQLDDTMNLGREEGLLTALEELDARVQRIAILEDNPDASRLIRRILQAQGEFLIEEAQDGLEGLALIKTTRPNLVIMDLMMPGLDGFDVIEAMKADNALKEIPVIVVTAKDLTADERLRLSGKIARLRPKGSFLDVDLIEDIREILV